MSDERSPFQLVRDVISNVRFLHTHALVLPADFHVGWFWNQENQEYDNNFVTITSTESLPQATYTSYKPKHILDLHYPHKCHRCKKPLYWEELYDANAGRVIMICDRDHFARIGPKWDFKTYKRLKKLWRSKVIQFYCCDCYRIKSNDMIP